MARPSPVRLAAPEITWRTDDLTIGQVESMLGRDFVARFFNMPNREAAIASVVGRIRGTWDANDREAHAAYRSLARLLGRVDEG